MSGEEQADPAAAFGLLASLPSAEGYTLNDKYRDFRQVLLGSDAGKRVLRELLNWTHTLRSSVTVQAGLPIDNNLTNVHEGERRIGLRLQITLLVEPKEGPTQQARRT